MVEKGVFQGCSHQPGRKAGPQSLVDVGAGLVVMTVLLLIVEVCCLEDS
jgi:hypothetical protein